MFRLDHSCTDITPNCHMIIVTEEEQEPEEEQEQAQEQAEEEEEGEGGGEMARFSLGREEDENEEGPSNPRRGRSVFKRRRTSAGVFSCSAVHREPEPEPEPETEPEPEPEQLCVIEERVIEEEEEVETEEEEDWGSDYESDDDLVEVLRGNGSISEVPIEDPDRNLVVLRGNGSISGIPIEDPGHNLEGLRGNGSISGILMEDPDRNLVGLRGNGSISEISMEDRDHNFEGFRENGSIFVTLSDPDVLDCPICLEHLCAPVFQCENGHIACDSCCIKIANKCPSCSWPIGYNRCRAIEKVLESVKVSCLNKRYGCKEIMSYSTKTDHENACIYVPCTCPFRGCDFVGTSTKVYVHFSDKHATSAEHIFFNAVHPIYLEKHQSYRILQMRTEGILFVVNHTSSHFGSAVNIVCIGPPTQKRRFLYDLVATDGESSFKLESVAESVPKWSSRNNPMKKFLMIPRDVVNSSAQLKLDVFIEEREYICSGCCTT